MMNAPYSKEDVIAHLREIQQGLRADIDAMPNAEFEREGETTWSPSGYVKHLILSLKPTAKGFNFPPEQLESTFGFAPAPSRTYQEVVVAYESLIEQGLRAELSDRLIPVAYRFPEGVTDEQAYLADTWDESNDRLIAALDPWDEAALDRYQLPHPALGMLTLREMLFFTLHHNTRHWQDVQQSATLSDRA
ncbi:MAG: DinB family protein [bacterium]|nr:DinB family protein [bacterium]